MSETQGRNVQYRKDNQCFIPTLNGVKLLNLFAGVDFNSEVVFGKTKEKNAILRTLLEDFNKPEGSRMFLYL